MDLAAGFKAGGTVEQLFLWGVMQQLVGALAAPYFTALMQDVQARHPDVELTPALVADAVVRGHLAYGNGETAAARSGVDPARFRIMVDNAGEAPGPAQLAEALRRGVIGEHGTGAASTSFEQGIRETRLANKWTGVIRDLAQVWPTPADILDAIVKGQVTPEQGQADYARVGGDPRWFQLLLDTVGEGPTPDQAAEAARRGIIPWDGTGPAVTSFEQAVRESHYRNKWQGVYRALAAYVTPPRTVTAMLREGALTEAQAARLLADSGVPTDLAQAYLAAAHLQKTKAHKDLTEAQVTQLYEAGIIAAGDTQALYEALGYTSQEAGLLIALADLRVEAKALSSAVSHVGALYIAHKITKTAATSALARLKVPATKTTQIVNTWDLERSVTVKGLTAAEIADAWHADIFTQGEATAELIDLGYTPFDAWAFLSIKNKAPLPGKPPRGASPATT